MIFWHYMPYRRGFSMRLFTHVTITHHQGQCMDLKGNFEGQNLTSIFQLLYTDQKTGFLRVSSDDKESRVYFNQGTIVYASSSMKKARLGFLMIQDGIISSKQLKECLALAKERGLSLGKILVDRGFIALQTLEKYNTRQVEEIIYNLLFWKKGKFEYKDARLNLNGMIATSLNPMKLILEASRRMDEMSVLTEAIPSERVVFKISTTVDTKEEFKLNANEWKVLSLIDGNRTVRQIIQDSRYDEFAVYKILFSVISYGLIEKKEELSPKASRPNSITNDAEGVIAVFDDIFLAVMKTARNELGAQADAMFDQAKEGLEPSYKIVLENYHPANEKHANRQSVITALTGAGVSDDRYFLVDAFAACCHELLIQLKDILGEYPVNSITVDIESVLGYIQKYQTSSGERNRIMTRVREVINEVTSS